MDEEGPEVEPTKPTACQMLITDQPCMESEILKESIIISEIVNASKKVFKFVHVKSLL
jgi:hypothetical protein